MNIIDRMFATMNEKNLKMADLANKLGINKSVISTWKSRKTNPPSEYTDCICEFLGISYEFYFKGTESISKDEKPKLTDEEKELLDTYNKLDKRGQHKLHTVIYEELDRIENHD